MLKNLLIKNYVLIEKLDIQLSSTLNIITGETGAGKSIILGALGLLLGKRADSKSLFTQNKKCVIEGEFDLSNYALESLFEDHELDYEKTSCVIRREITPSGKSRAFINDTPVNLTILKQISSRLIDIHSQHDTLLLGSEEYQRTLTDIWANNEKLVKNYKRTFHDFKEAEKKLEQLKKETQDIKKELDYHTFLLQELEKIELEALNQDHLEQRTKQLENAESIKTNLNLTLEQLIHAEFSIENLMQSVLTHLRPLTAFSTKYQALYERLESTSVELRDIAQEIEYEEETIFFNQEEYETLQTQISALYHLQTKHQVQEVEALIKIRDDLKQKIERVTNFDEELAQLEKQKQEKYKKLLETGKKLTQSRQNITPKIERELTEKLQFVGMPHARFKLQIKTKKPDISGCDAIEFMFSANKGVSPKTLKNSASGGEFSRLMLCIKRILAGKTALPTIIFDEIDTGISGEIAIKVSHLLHEMSHEHQLLVISHLPQTAANGNTHFLVYKESEGENTKSYIRQLSAEERTTEIAQMIGGKKPGKNAIESAKELLNLY